jgi:hypothetical protein
LPIGSSMGASHCKDEEWRPDLYLKVAASIVPKELDITSQGVADMSDEDVLRIIDAVRALVADVEQMLTPGQDHDLTCAEPLIDCSWCVSLVNACANCIWYGRAGRSGFKDELVLLVGWEAQSRDPRIRTMEATAPHTTSSTPCPLIAVTAYAYDVRSMPQGRSSKVGGGVRVTSRRDFCSARPGASLRLAFLKHRSLTPIKPARWWFFFQVSNFEQASPNQGA